MRLAPNSGARDRSRPALSREAFDAVLAVLDPDRERAGEKYELLRLKLIRFFEWRGCARPEDLADESIDRVGRRLAGGEQIRSAASGAYFLGVARYVLREWWLEARRGAPLDDRLDVADPSPATVDIEAEEPRAVCLERCLGALPPESRSLVLAYYEHDGGAKISRRRELADRLGIGPSALRLRVHRLRVLLEGCVMGCLAGRRASDSSWRSTLRSGRT